MPFTPEGIQRSMQSTPPEQKKRGDEGILTPAEMSDGNRYFVKEWRGKHPEKAHEHGAYFDEAAERSPVSPYWHKLKRREADLIHKLFPKETVRIVAGFDPRIRATEQGHTFQYQSGRPVTMTQEVTGDPQLKKERDALIDEGYAESEDAFITDKRGMLVANPDREGHAVEMVAIRVDWAIAERFGRNLRLHLKELTTKGLQAFVSRSRERREGGIFVEMAEAGIAPEHPEWNFLPTGEPVGNEPQGVFLEVVIVDPELLREKLCKEKSPEQQSRLNRSVDLFVWYDSLSRIYDTVMSRMFDKYGADEHPDVVNALFQLLEIMRKQQIKHPQSNFSTICEIVSEEIIWWSGSREDVAQKIERIRAIETKFLQGDYQARAVEREQSYRKEEERRKEQMRMWMRRKEKSAQPDGSL